jgi:hypothetical protein
MTKKNKDQSITVKKFEKLPYLYVQNFQIHPFVSMGLEHLLSPERGYTIKLKDNSNIK